MQCKKSALCDVTIHVLWKSLEVFGLAIIQSFSSGVSVSKIKLCILRPSTQTVNLCECVTVSYSALSRICCFSWSSCFKLSTSTFSSMFWNKEEQGSWIMIQHSGSAQNNSSKNHLFCYKWKNFKYNCTYSPNHRVAFSTTVTALQHAFSYKWCVSTWESSHSCHVRPSSCCLVSCCFTSLYSLYPNLSASAV